MTAPTKPSPNIMRVSGDIPTPDGGFVPRAEMGEYLRGNKINQAITQAELLHISLAPDLTRKSLSFDKGDRSTYLPSSSPA